MFFNFFHPKIQEQFHVFLMHFEKIKKNISTGNGFEVVRNTQDGSNDHLGPLNVSCVDSERPRVQR